MSKYGVKVTAPCGVEESCSATWGPYTYEQAESLAMRIKTFPCQYTDAEVVNYE